MFNYTHTHTHTHTHTQLLHFIYICVSFNIFFIRTFINSGWLLLVIHMSVHLYIKYKDIRDNYTRHGQI